MNVSYPEQIPKLSMTSHFFLNNIVNMINNNPLTS